MAKKKTPNMIACPEPGIYLDIPPEIYHGWDAVSQSRLKNLEPTPAHCKEVMDNPPQPTIDMQLGTILHALILEPQTIKDLVAVAPNDYDGRKKEWKEWREQQGTRIILSQEDFIRISAMQSALSSHPLFADYMSKQGQNEVSIVWTDIQTGLRCKARLDSVRRIGEDEWLIIDLKKFGRRATRHNLQRACMDWGYCIQEAFYTIAMENFFPPSRDNPNPVRFMFFAVEDKPPHGIQALTIAEETHMWARDKIHELLGIWQECITTGEWPNYAPEAIEISRPAWAKKGRNEE
jgi:hypothetical protein